MKRVVTGVKFLGLSFFTMAMILNFTVISVGASSQVADDSGEGAWEDYEYTDKSSTYEFSKMINGNDLSGQQEGDVTLKLKKIGVELQYKF